MFFSFFVAPSAIQWSFLNMTGLCGGSFGWYVTLATTSFASMCKCAIFLSIRTLCEEMLPGLFVWTLFKGLALRSCVHFWGHVLWALLFDRNSYESDLNLKWKHKKEWLISGNYSLVVFTSRRLYMFEATQNSRKLSSLTISKMTKVINLFPTVTWMTFCYKITDLLVTFSSNIIFWRKWNSR